MRWRRGWTAIAWVAAPLLALARAGAQPAAAKGAPSASVSTSASPSPKPSFSASSAASTSASAAATTATTNAATGATTTDETPTPPVDCSVCTEEAAENAEDEGKLNLHYELESIRIRGNKRTRDRTILRYVPFRPGDELDVEDPRLELVRFRLLGTGFFSDVQISLSKGPRRGVVVLNIDVVERNTIVVNDLWLGLSADATPDGGARPLTAYAGLDVAETNLYGTGISVGGAFAVADRQQAYRLRFVDPSFLGSNFIVSTTLLYNNARDFLGTRDVLWAPPAGEPGNTDYAIATYTRKGGEIGVGYDLSTSARIHGNYHLEVINAQLPLAASERRGLDVVPIEFHLIGGRSVLSYLSIVLDDDTRDDPVLATGGHFYQIGTDFGVPAIGGDYAFLRLQARAQKWFGLGFGPYDGDVIRIDLFGGAVFGDAPLFMKFYVGDLSDFLPDRALDLNFDRRPPPNFLHTDVIEMRYEDFAARISGEFRIPIYRGHRSIYGVDLFFSLGAFALASKRDFYDPPRGYKGFSKFPMDLTGNVGLRMQTSAGGFNFAFSNVIGFFPIRSEARP